MALEITGTLVIDCNNISCLTFGDTTGAVSLSNQSGYGSPNPELAEIVSIDFVITDSDAVDWEYSEADYSPNAAGNSTICLEAENFVNGSDTITFEPGATYTLTYIVHFSGSDYTLEEEFTFPCCGNPTTSNLATAIAIQQNIGCGSFVFSDVTGAYHATNNPGGYGSPNPAYADIVSTLITFVLSNGDTVNITTFIPTAADHSITIQASDLGYTTMIPDQIIGVTYSVFVDGDCRVGYKNTTALFYCQTESCINAKIASALNEDCACDGDVNANTQVVWEMLMELDTIKYAASKNMSCVDGAIESLFARCGAGCSNC